jgi:hypothetical protein
MLLSALWRFLLLLSRRLFSAFLSGLSRCFVGPFGVVMGSLSKFVSLFVVALSERLYGGMVGLGCLFVMLGSFLMCFFRQGSSPLVLPPCGRPLF